MNVADAKFRKGKLKDAAMDVHRKSTSEQRPLTTAEQSEYDRCIAGIKEIDEQIARHAELANFDKEDDNPVTQMRLQPGIRFVPEGVSEEGASLAQWMRNSKLAVDTPLRFGTSDGLNSAQITSVAAAVPTYFANDAYRLAGSTIYNTDTTTPLVQPIVSAGADFADFNEGSSATDSAPMEVDSFIFGGTKHARLVKVSEEALMNSALNLPGDITNELGATLINTITHTATTALKTALQGNSACFVDSGLDHYDACLSLTLAPPLRFQSPNNKFMLSRADLKRIKNVRSTQNEPLFDPESGTILGYGVVLNDFLDRIVFGNWQFGAFMRRSPLQLLRLLELYSANGYVGYKMTQWTDQKFLASVHAVTTQPLFYCNIETAGS